MSKVVTFVEGAVYRNKPFTGEGVLVRDFTAWKGAEEGEGKRRVGTGGAGYVKVRVEADVQERYGVRKPYIKVTVPAEGQGYVVEERVTEVDQIEAEVAEMVAFLETATGAPRAAARKRLARRQAKLAALTA